jgi:hypothetical protein
MMARDDASSKAPDYNHPIDFKALANGNKDFRDCLASNKGLFSFKKADHLRYTSYHPWSIFNDGSKLTLPQMSY